MNKSSIYAFYGSLRKGMDNYMLYGKGTLSYIGAAWLRGYKLYSLGDYPYAVKLQDSNDGSSILTELFHITDPMVEKDIHEMEIEAEYYYDEVTVSNKLFGIYLFEAPRPNDILIEHGDWVKFVEQNR